MAQAQGQGQDDWQRDVLRDLGAQPGARTGTSSPDAGTAPMSASVARTPGPPALVRMVRRGPRGRGCFASASAM